MNIIMVNTSDSGGGAERITSTLADGYRGRGHHVTILCTRASRSGSRSLMGKVDWLLGRTLKQIGYADAISLAAWRFLDYPEVREADIVHFHNLHGFYFGMAMLPKIIAAKPCVWTLHDLWGISGGCYGQLGCQKWLQACQACPGHGVFPMTGLLDTASQMLAMKREAFRSLSAHGGIITGVSKWLTDRIHQAFLAADINSPITVRCVPNYVDISSRLNRDGFLPITLPANRPVLLLVAADINNEMKGMTTALGALQLNLEKSFTLLTMGRPFPDSILRQYGLADRTIQLGYLHDRMAIAAAYSSATVTIVPSLAESFCLVAAESIASGTPVVASNVAALPELVRNGETGYLAMVQDISDFSSKIGMFLEMSQVDHDHFRASTIKFAEKDLISFDHWLDTYMDLYNKAIWQHSETQVLKEL